VDGCALEVDLAVGVGTAEGDVDISEFGTAARFGVEEGKSHCGGRKGRHTLSSSQLPEQHLISWQEL